MNKNISKILIADDNIIFNNILKRSLKEFDYQIQETSDGNSTFKELSRNIYDLCLLDINMPGKSGLEILKEIKSNQNIYTSIIMMTGDDDNQTIIKVMRLGADDYIQKPFELNELYVAIKKSLINHNIKLENIRYKKYLEEEVNNKTKEINKAFFDMITAVANAIEARDNYTGHHVKRVSEISVLIGRKLGFTAKKLNELKIGGILHDIGKIGVPDSILNKPGPLSKEEFAKIKLHPELGFNIIKNINSLKPIVSYILYHHEKYDGTGYPEGLRKENIPIEGRILALADALDAMTTSRPYREAFSKDKAYDEIIKNSGSQFDPNIVTIFKELWDEQILQKKYLIIKREVYKIK